jgi:hypothetical protein
MHRDFMSLGNLVIGAAAAIAEANVAFSSTCETETQTTVHELIVILCSPERLESSRRAR